MSVVAFYMGISVVLESAFNIDICIPCLWKTFLGFECPGCGLTTAVVKLLQLDLAGAYQSNMLVYLVVPVGLFFIFTDYNNFKMRVRTR